MKEIKFDEFPCGEDRYNLEDCLGCGAFGKVYVATDTEANDKKVAIKVQRLNDETKKYVGQEYKVLRDFSNHTNLPDFYGIYRSQNDDIWFVMEFCEGGSLIDLVNGILNKNRRMAEEHIAYILKETIKALIYLHENKIMHRDVRASNILLTKEGEVKLTDFGSSCSLLNTLDKTGTRIGSPCWMAPELVLAKVGDEYCNRVDVWSLGITAIELGDGEAPYQRMHPTRALFQIVRNPPPKLYRPSNWSENFNDFISECLEKNPEYRPYIMEVAEHPFLEQVPENNYHLTLEVKSLLESLDRPQVQIPEVVVNGNFLKKGIDQELESMLMEDLAALEHISEEAILHELKERYKLGDIYSFVGDILLFLNPNEVKDIYNNEYRTKYHFKSRSDNAPHVYAIGDSAYQNALHHQVPQKIVLAGESRSGKTFNYFQLLEHLFFLGINNNISIERLRNAAQLIHYFISASTPINASSTRAVLKTTLTYNTTGKLSGAIFKMYQLEKWRISCVDMFQGNFQVLYYVYDGLSSTNKLSEYELNSDRNYRYLRISNKDNAPENDIQKNIICFKSLMKTLEDFDFTEEEITTIFSIIAAILITGEIRFRESENSDAVIETIENVEKVATLLKIDPKKFAWALTNYCLIQKGTAVKRRSSVDEARDARDVFANNLYCRLVDYILSAINHKLSIGRKIFGDKYSIEIFDYFGFECFKRNHLPQLFINSFNEQLHYHYLQRLFSWESMDISEEEIEYEPFSYYDNKATLDQLLGKSDGVFSYIDEASKMNQGGQYVIDYIQSHESQYINVQGDTEFSVAHYTGKVTYDAKEMPDKNRDFLPPEIIESLRLSNNATVKLLFSNKLDKTGNLIVAFEDDDKGGRGPHKIEQNNSDKVSGTQYSQIKKLRTSIATFKALSLELLKELSIGSGTGSTHFVRCIRTDLKNRPQYFKDEIVRQQLRALAVVETAKGRQKGYPCRINFSEFLRRYQFLAFDFDENVDITRDNCRLLLIRLKMEGWAIGKTKVFLKYYNEEYLSRLYEVQVKKIIKIQSILRRFLAKCRLAKSKPKDDASISAKQKRRMSEDEAAIVIQRAYRGIPKNAYNKNYKLLDEETCRFIRSYARKWRTNSLFHVLMQYRAIKFQETFSFAQQIHMYNLNVYCKLKEIRNDVDLNAIHERANFASWLGDPKPTVLKIPFRLSDIDYYDTSAMCDLLTNPGVSGDAEDAWDTPYRWRKLSCHRDSLDLIRSDENIIYHPYSRDPEEPIVKLPQSPTSEQSIKQKKNKENRETQHKFQKFDDSKVNSNTKPANKDFDYIRPPVAASSNKLKPDPIAELRNIGRRDSTATDDDDPPFNFKGMLRKTNFQRDSFKRETSNVVVNFNQKQLKNVPKKMDYVNGATNSTNIKGNKVSLELVPGVFIEGVEVDL